MDRVTLLLVGCFLPVFLAGTAASDVPNPLAGRHTLIWMCLERCSNFNLTEDLAQLAAFRDYITVVSPENWQVGPGGKFEWAQAGSGPVSDVRKQVQDLGYPYFPMLTSANIYDLRNLFANPYPLINQSIATAKQYNYIGYHIDFEPDNGVVANDAALYAKFLSTYADALHAEGLLLAADVATWSPFWDFSLLATTKLDRIVTMETYTNQLPRFTQQVEYTVGKLGVNMTGIGFDSDMPDFTPDLLDQMLQVLISNKVTGVHVWHDNVPFAQEWIDFFGKFLKA